MIKTDDSNNYISPILKETENNNSIKFKDIPKPKEGMNILNLIKYESYYCQISLSLQEKFRNKITNYTYISKKLKVSRMTISRIVNLKEYWINLNNLLNLSDLLQIEKNEIFLNINLIKTKNSFPIQFNVKNLISPALFRIIGHILGDGGIQVIEKEGKYRAFYTNNKLILINSFKEDIITVFGKINLYFRKKKTGTYEIWLPTTIGYLFYDLLEYKKLKNDKRIPDFILNNKDKKVIGPFLQALYDDEGFLYPQKNMIVIAQKRIELINDIRDVVINLGIRPNQLLIHKSKDKITMHYFSITHKDNIKLFNDLIGFKHPEKIEKLRILMEKYKVN